MVAIRPVEEGDESGSIDVTFSLWSHTLFHRSSGWIAGFLIPPAPRIASMPVGRKPGERRESRGAHTPPPKSPTLLPLSWPWRNPVCPGSLEFESCYHHSCT